MNCISCNMPLNEETISKFDTDECIHCQNQETGELATYEQVREGSINAAIEKFGKTREEAEEIANEKLPKLPRWKK